MTLKSQVFTSSGTFNVPAGVSCVWADGTAAGAGGAPYFGAAGGGGGGSGEALYKKLIKVTPGGTLVVTVGVGGPAGVIGVFTFNCILGPQGNTNGSAGGGSVANNNAADSIIGPIRVRGGYGGGAGDATGSGAIGGGVAAWREGNNPGQSGTNAGVRLSGFGSNGFTADRRSGSSVCWAGSGSAAGSFINGQFPPGGRGGNFGPWQGGAGGTGSPTAGGGGGGGGASRYGPGGQGGNGSGTTPAVPAGSYGAGGGGGGASDANCAAGKGGYVQITWVEP